MRRDALVEGARVHADHGEAALAKADGDAVVQCGVEQAGEIGLAGRSPVRVARIGHRRAEQGRRGALQEQAGGAAQCDFRPGRR